MLIEWKRIPPSTRAHCYPVLSDRETGRRHFCQGMHLTSLMDPMDPRGKRPLYTRGMMRAMMRFCRGEHRVCPGCYGVVYWLFGEAVNVTVTDYRLQAERRARGIVADFLDACSPTAE